MEWRLILDEPARGSWNMAVDEAVAEAVDRGGAPPTLRLYRWRPPCLSLGFSQPYGVADAAFCAGHGIDVVRRPTGGRAVLHHLELTYSVAAPLRGAVLTTDLQASYRRICAALVDGLRRLGVPADLSGRPEGGYVRPVEAVPCFIGPAAGEVVAGGRKLVGSAMRRLGDTILQHGSILEGWDGSLQAGCLGLPDDVALRAAVSTVSDHAGAVAPDAIADAVVAGFAETLGIEPVAGTLGDAEVERAGVLEAERYGHRRWTERRDPSLPGS